MDYYPISRSYPYLTICIALFLDIRLFVVLIIGVFFFRGLIKILVTFFIVEGISLLVILGIIIFH